MQRYLLQNLWCQLVLGHGTASWFGPAAAKFEVPMICGGSKDQRDQRATTGLQLHSMTFNEIQHDNIVGIPYDKRFLCFSFRTRTRTVFIMFVAIYFLLI